MQNVNVHVFVFQCRAKNLGMDLDQQGSGCVKSAKDVPFVGFI